MLDQDGERARASRRHQEWYVPPPEVTLGRAIDIESFIREYKDYAIHSTSMEIATESAVLVTVGVDVTAQLHWWHHQ